MKKILVDQCLQCWHCDDDTYHCRETGERIINPYVIPADCPLDDEPEQKPSLKDIMDSKNQTQKREIKFRAWDGENKQFWKQFDVSSIYGSAWFSDMLKDWIVEQFTGLHDCTGKEIYEGDIVSDDEKNRVVIYQAPSFVMKSSKNAKTWIEFNRHPDDNQFQEVIGNIHENPELL